MSEGALLSEKERFDVAISVIEGNRSKYLEVIKAINKRVFPTKTFDRKQIKQMLNEKRSVLVVVEDTETKKIVGYALTTATNKPQTAHYISNALIPKFQGKRIVEKLSSKVEEELRQKGFFFILETLAFQMAMLTKCARHTKIESPRNIRDTTLWVSILNLRLSFNNVL